MGEHPHAFKFTVFGNKIEKKAAFYNNFCIPKYGGSGGETTAGVAAPGQGLRWGSQGDRVCPNI